MDTHILYKITQRFLIIFFVSPLVFGLEIPKEKVEPYLDLLTQSENRSDWDRFYFDTKNIYRFFYVKNSQLERAKSAEELKKKPYYYVPICASKCEYFLVLENKDYKFVSIGHQEIAKRIFSFEDKMRSLSVNLTRDILEFTEKNILVAELSDEKNNAVRWQVVANDSKPLSSEMGNMINLFRDKKAKELSDAEQQQAPQPGELNESMLAENEAKIQEERKIRIWLVTFFIFFVGLSIVLYKVKRAKRS